MAGILSLNRERSVAVIDIGSGYVWCAFMHVPQKGLSRIFASGYSTLSLEERTPEQAVGRVTEEIAEAVKRTRASLPLVLSSAAPDRVYVVLHAPWTSSKILTGRRDFPGEIRVHASHIASIAQQSLTAESLDRQKLLEAGVLSVRLNGYPTNRPEGKYARSLDVVSIASACDRALKANITTALEASLPSTAMHWRSAERVTASVLLRGNDSQNAVVVNVGVLASSVTVLRDGIPTDQHVVQEGVRSILARVHGARPPEETLGLFRMLERDACADDACLALQKAIALAEPELVRVFGEVFSACAHERKLPNNLILIAHQDLLSWLGMFLARIDFTQFTVTAMPFNVTQLDAGHMDTWVRAETPVNPMLALDCAYAAIEEQST
ncbi:hypothetical protein K8R03_04120 [Candidatus Kaiserbacteria bacterium]|nr:hypothetical protein [Candidatus Kaiserbacteria bacterium]